MRAAVALLIVVFAACAVLASHQNKPFELRVDANPGPWPTKAQGDAPANALLTPCPLTPQNLPIVNPGRIA